MKAVDDYKNFIRREHPMVDAKKRAALTSIKETIPVAWLEALLGIGGHERGDGTYATYDDVTEKELYEMYRKRRTTQCIPLAWTHLKEKGVSWKFSRSAFEKIDTCRHCRP